MKEQFTREDLQRQLDAAIELIVFLIEHQIASERARGTPERTSAEAQARIPSIMEKMQVIDERRPDAAIVLAAVIERLADRGRTH